MANDSVEDNGSTDFDLSEIGEIEGYTRWQSKDVSIEENQDLDDIVPFDDVHSNVQPMEINRGNMHVPTYITSDIDDERPSESNIEECLRAESESENGANPDRVASVEGMGKDITIETDGGCKAMENEPGREVAQAEDWVLIIAAILKQRGKEMEWEEIVNNWVILQRYWGRVEVS